MIPDWIVIKKLSEITLPIDFQLDMDKWPAIAKERAERFTRGEKWYPRTGGTTEEDKQEIYNEFAGHALLRLAAGENTRIFGWVIEQEGDLFEYRFRHVRSLQTQIEIAQYIFGKERVLGPRALWNKFDINNHYFKDFKMGDKRMKSIGMHFTCVPRIIGNRSNLLRNGWVLGLMDDFVSSIKLAFEQILRDRIKETAARMDRTIRKPLRKIQEELGQLIHSMARSSGMYDFEGYKLYRRQDIFPQCMLDLYNEVMTKGHLGHEERFQLGLFLKKMGMSIDEQLEFWYNNAVDNTGLSFEQFSSGNPGYIIRHMYGLEGGETDYSAPNCETIQNQYYCTFMHQAAEKIDENIRKEFKNPSEQVEQKIRYLERKVIDKKPSEACAQMFSLRYHRGCKPVSHPVNYARYAARVKGIIKSAQDKKEEEEKKKSS
jgi:DNA primase large subunit